MTPARFLRGVYHERLDLSLSTSLAEGLRMTTNRYWTFSDSLLKATHLPQYWTQAQDRQQTTLLYFNSNNETLLYFIIKLTLRYFMVIFSLIIVILDI